MAAGEILRVSGGAEVRGSFTGAGREAILAAPIARDLLIAAGVHRIESRIGGSALLLGDELTIGESAVTEGKIEFYGGSEPSVAPGARLAFPVTFEQLEEGDEEPHFSWITRFVFFWAAAFFPSLAWFRGIEQPCRSSRNAAYRRRRWQTTDSTGIVRFR